MTNPFVQWLRASAPACALAIACVAQTGAAFAARATANVAAAVTAPPSVALPDAPAGATSSGTSAAIRGTVVDAQTGKPIAAAIVTIDGHPIRTDDQGAFSADTAATDIAARAPGYLAARAPIEAGRPVTVALAPFRPKAVYLSAFGITSKTLRDAAVNLKDTTAINALVIDMKGDRGVTPYPSAARRASGAAEQAPNAPVVRDFAALVADLHRRGLYLIARIVVFKDDPLAAAHPDWTVRDAGGDIWHDREELRWIDPSLREAWTHNLDVAEEAAKLGFDEIQFDYVRFPDARGLRFSVPNTRANRTAAISGFLQAARERLAPYNVFVAADIFGYVCWNEDDTAIGQQIEMLGGPLDYISPMLYPSGFTWGLPGCTQPTADPGQIVRRSLAEARSRTRLPGVRFRPWLQAFRDYAFDHRDFAAAEIRAQVDAAEAADTDGWMLWNARNRYDPQQLPK
ncbi:GTP-binding protein [Burkholderia thailandensis]|uniref:Carboxypeptidase regulatory-like domain protein n=1 Tax=Burkholderia thailandensis TaxID=57975 RepID=A0AAW9CL16_BURTH|nr:putative glycoside hydrolase [Burkholderia thailandensis]AHI66679.1 putative glycosyl hydrolase domain protein [Burkholderia thailandensis H0587]AOJ54773.1 GTP-binding protein [Burkholderia thailandensis]AVR29263.1 GTP-binding protein [Burkholderia thailandensis]MCS3395367.1 GTP-binding protein [Burkholderia thailandensis]MCS6428871.1 GTP-binding protein [Burkholderia thailandensis]